MKRHEVRKQAPIPELYHYTNAAGFLGIFEQGSIWASSALHLNDSREYRLGIDALRIALEELSARTSGTKKKEKVSEWIESLETVGTQVQLFVASFSEERDLLSQWLAYGGANSYSIGLRRAHFRPAFSKGFRLMKCIYEEREHIKLAKSLVRRIFEPTFEQNGMALFNLEEVFAAMASMKHKGFEQEAEWRLVRPSIFGEGIEFRPGRNGIVPFIQAPLLQQQGTLRPDSVTIGPNQDVEAAAAALESFLTTRNMRGLFIKSRPEVFRSATPYRP